MPFPFGKHPIEDGSRMQESLRLISDPIEGSTTEFSSRHHRPREKAARRRLLNSSLMIVDQTAA
jgi:hypothetical protein